MAVGPESIYEPLQTSTSVRVLRLWRNQDGGGVEAVLKQVDLDHDDCPPFTTISYVWGTAMSGQTIAIHGTPKPVLETLVDLLDLLCDSPDFQGDGYYWIDSICIDQTNITERQAQVALMDRVFRQSRSTIAWLGPGNASMDEAMDFLCTLANTWEPQHDFNYRHIRRMHPAFNLPSKWQSLELLFSLPWWARAWTLQEMVLPSNLFLFHCGPKRIDLGAFAVAMSTLWCCNPAEHLIKSSTWRGPWTRLRLGHWYSYEPWRDSISLVALLAYSGNCRVTDPRDRIYSLLGMARPGDRELVGHPDYTLDIRTGYINLVKNIIEKRRSLDIICLAHLFRARERDRGQETPTWVPDWSVHVDPFVAPVMVCQGSKNLMTAFDPSGPALYEGRITYDAASDHPQPQVSFSKDATQIICRGFVIDRLDGLGALDASTGISEPRIGGLVQSTSMSNTRRPSSEQDQEENLNLVDMIIRCLMLNRKNRYLTRPISKVMHQLRYELGGALTTTIEYADEGMLQYFRSWLRSNGSLLLRGTALKEVFEAFVAPTKARNMRYGPFSKISTTETSFLSRFRDTTLPYTMARRLVTTRKGYLGMSPLHAQKDDVVCVLFGCSVPVVLRPVVGLENTFEFVGECYLDGYMYGEGRPRKTDGQESQEHDLILI